MLGVSQLEEGPISVSRVSSKSLEIQSWIHYWIVMRLFTEMDGDVMVSWHQAPQNTKHRDGTHHTHLQKDVERDGRQCWL